MKIAAVIVTYNSERAISRCVEACLRQGIGEIIVVDNASGDATRREAAGLTGVRLIESSENRGFAAAANQGMAAGEAPLALLLNPDTEPMLGLDELAAACGSPRVGAAAGMLLGADGAAQTGFNVRSLPTP